MTHFMILLLIFCVGLHILLLSLNLMRYYAFKDTGTLVLAVFQILVLTLMVHTLEELI